MAEGSSLALEPRVMLDGNLPGVLISEFLASNSGGIKDRDGDSSDWIELYNPGVQAVDLEGWSLTDDADAPGKWHFPDVVLDSGQFLVVFASGKNRAVPGDELHTNFKISAGGGYLALVEPDGSLADSYSPSYPAQRGDISYGHPSQSSRLVARGAGAFVLVPTDGSLGTTWTNPAFAPNGWTTGPTALGYGVVVPGFSVQFAKSNIGLPDLTTARAMLDDPSLQAYTVNVDANVINYLDTGPSSNFLDDQPFPSLSIGVDESYYAIRAAGTVRIPTAGPWTFGVNSDDGFELVLERNGQVLRSSFEDLRGPDNTLATFDIPEAGEWSIRLISFENEGWSSVELFAAMGSRGGFDSDFRLVGDAAGGGLAVFHDPSDGAGVETDLRSAMQGQNATAYVRIPFQVGDPSAFDVLALRMRYDDGFVAYLNGVEVARRNAPGVAAWNSTATAARPAADILTPETIGLTDRLGLLRSGTNVLAIQVLNVSADDGDLLLFPELIATTLNAGQGAFFASATPGDFNGTAYAGLVEEVAFSVGRGFYDAPFDVSLSTSTAGAAIYYTTDGSTPGPANGQPYAGPITIDRTTTLRAAAFLDTYLEAKSRTASYLFLDDVIRQSADGSPPPGWPAGWGSNAVDYGMDPDIVNDPVFGGDNLKNALKSIPTISLTTDLANLFDPATGIYANPYGKGDPWERPTSVELINPDGTAGFQINAGLRIRGGYSRDYSNPKHAFRLFFNGDYDGDLDFPLFGNEGVSSFAKVDLRTDQNYSWSFGGDGRHTAVRDVFARDTQRDMGEAYTRSRYYHLYIDGQYWGMFQTQERAEANYAASYFGGNPDDYDVVKVENYSYEVYATDGNMDAWRRLYDAAMAGFASNEDYFRIQGKNPDGTDNPAYENLVDVDNLIDYMQVILFTGNFDAPISAFLGEERPNNFYAIRNRIGRDGFRFFAHDSEHTLLDPYVDRNGPFPAGSEFRYFNPQYLHQKLMENPEYRLRFADKVQEHFFHGGALTPERAIARFQARAGQIDQAILGESARWGDSKVSTPFTRNDWLAAISSVVDGVLPYRTGIVLDQFRGNGLYPALAAPTFLVNGVEVHGGHVQAGTALRLGTPGSLVYYTLDGSDPRAIGGGFRPEALVFDPATSPDLVLDATTRITMRAYDGANWSALDSADFSINDPASAANLVVTELDYNPHAPDPATGELTVDKDDFEFIELRNIGAREIDLSQVRFTTGITFDFTGSAVPYLAPGAYVLVVKNPDAFRSRYGDVAHIAGTYSGNLSNGGERIQLVDAGGATIADFTYDDEGAWPTAPDGQGKSLVAIRPSGDLSSPSSWRESVERGGSPGGRGNTAPDLAVPADLTIDEDTGASGLAVSIDDAESPVASLVVTISSEDPDLIPPADLELSGSGGNRLLSFVPAADRSGTTRIQVSVDDGAGGVTTRWFTVTVSPVNDAPTGQPDSYETDEDTPLVVPAGLGVLRNDSDVEGGPLTAQVVTPPALGKLTLAADGGFMYEPNANANGDDSFTYLVGDGTATGGPVTVSLRVRPVNDVPVGRADAYETDEDVTLVVAAGLGVLRNDSDVEGGPLTAQLVTPPALGKLTLAADGGFTYEPYANANGDDSFTYVVSDGTATSGPVTVSLRDRPVNDAPVLEPIGDRRVAEGSLLQFRARATDVETPSNQLVFTLAPGAPAGMTIDTATGDVSWTADRGPRDLVVTVIVTDKGSPARTARRDVAIHVDNVAPQVVAGPEVQAVAGEAFAIAGAYRDPGADQWTGLVDYGDGSGTQPLSLNADKTFNLAHTYAAAGQYTVTVRIADGGGASDEARFLVNVGPAPDRVAPTFLGLRADATRRNVSALRLSFSEPIEASRAADLASYRLVQAGRDRRFGTRDDRVVALRSAVLEPGGTSVKLTPKRPLSLRTDYRLEVLASSSQGLTDTSGNLLDGNRDGTPGDSALTRFSVNRGGSIKISSRAVDALSSAGSWPSPPRRFRGAGRD